MEILESKVFDKAIFGHQNDEHTRKSAEGITYHDAGILPLQLPTIRIYYKKGIYSISVSTSSEETPEVCARISPEHISKSNLFLPGNSELRLTIDGILKGAKERLLLDPIMGPALKERYLCIETAEPETRSHRYATIQFRNHPGNISDEFIDMMKKLYPSSKVNPGEGQVSIQVEGATIQYHGIGFPTITIRSETHQKETDFNKLESAILQAKFLQTGNPHMDYSNSMTSSWISRFTFPNPNSGGQAIVEEAFREDINQLQPKTQNL